MQANTPKDRSYVTQRYFIRYHLLDAYDAQVTQHPQRDVESLGIDVLGYAGFPIGDIVIMEVSDLPDQLPSYITLDNGTLLTDLEPKRVPGTETVWRRNKEGKLDKSVYHTDAAGNTTQLN